MNFGYNWMDPGNILIKITVPRKTDTTPSLSYLQFLVGVSIFKETVKF